MPKGGKTYLAGGGMTCFKCACMEVPKTFTTDKQVDMFVRLHKKVCEKMSSADTIRHIHDRGSALQDLQIDLRQSLIKSHKLVDKLY
jgi:hypothetical protein